MVRTCCSGLGQSEDPAVLADEIRRAHQIFQATALRIPSGNVDLAERAIVISNWFGAVYRDMGSQRFRDVRVKVNTLYGLITDLSRRIGETSSAGKTELERAQVGSSFANQLLAAFGLIPESQIYRPDVPGGGAADATATALKWALPVGAGVLLLLLLRR